MRNLTFRIFYNYCFYMARQKGYIPTEETKRKMSEAKKEWHRCHIHPLLGKHHSEETRQKLRNITINRCKSNEYKLFLSKQNSRFWTGKNFSEETKRKMSLAKLGKRRDKETCKKISNGHKGNKSYLWKGGRTKLREQIKNSWEYKDWRSKIFIRDKYMCRICKNIGGKLQVHHIISLVDIIERNKITTIDAALLCKELWNIDNGITLCIKCHSKTFGYKRKIQ